MSCGCLYLGDVVKWESKNEHWNIYVLKRLEYMMRICYTFYAQKSTYFWFFFSFCFIFVCLFIFVFWEGGGIWPFNEHTNLHFETKSNIHVTSEIYKENGYGHNLHLTFILHISRRVLYARAQHFPSNLYPHPNHNHRHRPMPTHGHPCYSNCAHVFKNCVMCITRLHQVLVGSDKQKVIHCRWLQPGALLG